MLENYNSEWYELFKKEEKAILAAVNNEIFIEIHHIGSTAVPGMVAKPIIDIMVGVNEIKDFEFCITALQAVKYKLLGECGRVERLFFVKGSLENCTHHLHLVVKKSKYWLDNISLRELLLNNKLVAQDYSRFKQKLALENANERDRYRVLKSEYVEKILMDITAVARRECMLRLRENLVAVEEDRLAGKKGFTIDEVDEMMKRTIEKDKIKVFSL